MYTEDDLIVVDDEPAQEAPQASSQNVVGTTWFYEEPQTIAQSVMRQTRSKRATEDTPFVPRSERSTRSSMAGPKSRPKLKLKLSEKAGMVTGTSFLGNYDRELDSEDEDLTFEEQFILRMPPGEDCEKLRKMVSAREADPDVWFKFKDSRRAVFHIGNALYSAKLVDLPCIIEAQKTLDSKQMFKVADICQMLVVENKVDSEDAISNQKNFNIDEFIWPHGLTPPLHHVRKRRFRKRVNKRTIETVEEEVERLLEADALADQVQYEILENVNPDLSDSEFVEREATFDAQTPHPGSDVGDAPTPAGGAGEDGEGEDGEGEDGEGDFDAELAAELNAELNAALVEDLDEEDADDEDEDGSDEDEDEEDDDDEAVQSKRLLNEEIRDLEAAVRRKENEIAGSANPLIRRRFEDALKKLQLDLEMKRAQRDDLTEQQRMRKEGMTSQRGESEPNDDGDDVNEE